MPRVVTVISEEALAERRRRGVDKRDEVWEGVLHMVPPPEIGHQESADDLRGAFRTLLRNRHPDACIVREVALSNPTLWPNDFRVPDMVVCLDRADVKEKYVTGADLVVEIRSADDTTYEKFTFFADQGVKELLIVRGKDEDLELHVLAGRAYRSATPNPDGWLVSGTGMEFRWAPTGSTLQVGNAGHPESEETVAFKPA